MNVDRVHEIVEEVMKERIVKPLFDWKNELDLSGELNSPSALDVLCRGLRRRVLDLSKTCERRQTYEYIAHDVRYKISLKSGWVDEFLERKAPSGETTNGQNIYELYLLAVDTINEPISPEDVFKQQIEGLDVKRLKKNLNKLVGTITAYKLETIIEKCSPGVECEMKPGKIDTITDFHVMAFLDDFLDSRASTWNMKSLEQLTVVMREGEVKGRAVAKWLRNNAEIRTLDDLEQYYMDEHEAFAYAKQAHVLTSRSALKEILKRFFGQHQGRTWRQCDIDAWSDEVTGLKGRSISSYIARKYDSHVSDVIMSLFQNGDANILSDCEYDGTNTVSFRSGRDVRIFIEDFLSQNSGRWNLYRLRLWSNGSASGVSAVRFLRENYVAPVSSSFSSQGFLWKAVLKKIGVDTSKFTFMERSS